MTGEIVIECGFSDSPLVVPTDWTRIDDPSDEELEIEEVGEDQLVWFRAALKGADGSPGEWSFPISVAEDIDFYALATDAEYQNQTIRIERDEANEKLKLSARVTVRYRAKVRVRVKTKKPKIVVRKPLPRVKVDWRGPVPSVTVDGPDVLVEDLPKVNLPKIDNPIKDSSTPDEVSIGCSLINGQAVLHLYNGEDSSIQVWINWKGTIVGDIRMDPNSRRKLPSAGYSQCAEATDNIFIEKVEFA